MLVNLHTHTPRCNHAKGSEREYIERAIESGIRTLGFSDHAPMPFDTDYISWFRMSVDQIEDYVTTLLDLKREYAGQIELLIGFEAEYYPRCFENMLRLMSAYPVDYLLLGQHFLGNEYDSTGCGNPTADENRLREYVDQSCEGMATGCFTYFAHPELLRYIGDDEIYCRHMRRLCENAKKMEVPLELNLLGLYEGRHYPDTRFLRIAAETGNTIVLGTDAHRVERIGEPTALRMADELIKKYGLKVTEDIPLRDPFHYLKRIGK